MSEASLCLCIAAVRSWAGVAEGEGASAHRRREEIDLQAAIQVPVILLFPAHLVCPVHFAGC